MVESENVEHMPQDNRVVEARVEANESQHADGEAEVDVEDVDADDIDVESKLLENGNANKSEKNEKTEQNRTISEEIDKLLNDMPLKEDWSCGFWIFRGKFLQRFANQTAYVVLYGIVGCIFSMTYAYFNGTITTLEKRYKIPSRNTGIISVGNDISQMMVSAVLGYYGGKGHRPRWIGFGLMTIVLFCGLTTLPHFIYGPGEDALALTYEFGGVPDANATMEAIEMQRSKILCMSGRNNECEKFEGNFAPQVFLFVAQFISGIGGSLYFTLGVAYMDDNTKKSKTPALLSLSYFLRMLGPAIGYALCSVCLRVYIAPQLHAVIDNNDPRWLGAWWMGWLIMGGLLLFFTFFIFMFPKQLPRAAARRMIEEERRKQRLSLKSKEDNEKEQLAAEFDKKPSTDGNASFKDMIKTFKRLMTNKTMLCNNLSSVFYIFGYMPYWIFTPKYIEIQYRQSAATSSMVTGTVALAFSAVGVLLSGFVISRYKPSARYMAGWNVLVGVITVVGVLAYSFIGCPGNDSSVVVNIHDSTINDMATCNSACGCDFVRYSPVCGENNMTYISACHAGCKRQNMTSDGRKIFYDCSCIPSGNLTSSAPFGRLTGMEHEHSTGTTFTSTSAAALASLEELSTGGQALPGACQINCWAQFVTFLCVMCCMKFFGSTGRATNFLVSVRCVPEKDKTAAMGLGMMMLSMMAFIPSPIFFGWMLDRLCLVWGKTCSNKGNCWLYDPQSLRYTLNFTSAIFISIGTLFDAGVWYYVKDLKIFDEKVKDVELEIVQREEERNAEKKTEI